MTMEIVYGQVTRGKFSNFCNFSFRLYIYESLAMTVIIIVKLVVIA